MSAAWVINPKLDPDAVGQMLRELAVAVVLQAAKDARIGNLSARKWLTLDGCLWMEALGLSEEANPTAPLHFLTSRAAKVLGPAGEQLAMELHPLAEKRCPDCGQTKPLTEFYKRRTAEDLHRIHCKACENARSKARRQRNRRQFSVTGG